MLEFELESYISVDQKESSFPKTMTIYISGIVVLVLARELGGDALLAQVCSDSRARPFLASGEH